MRLRLAGADNFPSSLFLLAPALAERPDIRELRQLNSTLSGLVCTSETHGHCHDFSQVFNGIGTPFDDWQEDVARLLDCLRRQGAGRAADALAELVALKQEQDKASNAESQRDPLHRAVAKAQRERLAAKQEELLRPGRMLPIAFELEAALGRFLWERLGLK